MLTNFHQIRTIPLKYADGHALEQLTFRRETLSVINTETLNQQKAKVERVYNHRKKRLKQRSKR